MFFNQIQPSKFFWFSRLKELRELLRGINARNTKTRQMSKLLSPSYCNNNIEIYKEENVNGTLCDILEYYHYFGVFCFLLVDFGSFHSRVDNVINDSFNYTVTRHR